MAESVEQRKGWLWHSIVFDDGRVEHVYAPKRSAAELAEGRPGAAAVLAGRHEASRHAGGWAKTVQCSLLGLDGDGSAVLSSYVGSPVRDFHWREGGRPSPAVVVPLTFLPEDVRLLWRRVRNP